MPGFDASLPPRHQIPRTSPFLDSDEDGQEPDTEESEPETVDGDEEEFDHPVAASQESKAEIVDLMERSRLTTRSPTREPQLWIGPFSPYTAYFDTSANAKKNKLGESTESSTARENSDKK